MERLYDTMLIKRGRKLIKVAMPESELAKYNEAVERSRQTGRELEIQVEVQDREGIKETPVKDIFVATWLNKQI